MDTWRLLDRLWAMMEPLLPAQPNQSRVGRPPVSPHSAMEAIWLIMRTGYPWRALNATTLCSSAIAEWRFRDWKPAGVFDRLHRASLDAAHVAGTLTDRPLNLASPKPHHGAALYSPIMPLSRRESDQGRHL